MFEILLFVLFNNPSLQEFVQFDKTNELSYTETFQCVEFTAEFVNNAQIAGFDAYPVTVGFWSSDVLLFHEFAAVDYEGVTYWIEPQSDDFFVIAKAGESLCFTSGQCFGRLAFVIH